MSRLYQRLEIQEQHLFIWESCLDIWPTTGDSLPVFFLLKLSQPQLNHNSTQPNTTKLGLTYGGGTEVQNMTDFKTVISVLASHLHSTAQKIYKYQSKFLSQTQPIFGHLLITKYQYQQLSGKLIDYLDG